MSGAIAGLILSSVQSLAPAPPAPTYNSTTIAADPGDGAFTVLYSGPAVDVGQQTLLLNWSFVYQGANYTKLGISSDCFVCFGTAGTTFAFPGNIWTANAPAYPGIGVCADPTAATDTNYQFVGYRNIDASTTQIRWKGGYPYSYTSGVNRTWDMTFYSGSNQIRIDLYQIVPQNASGTGSQLNTKSASAFLSNIASPANNTAYIINC